MSEYAEQLARPGPEWPIHFRPGAEQGWLGPYAIAMRGFTDETTPYCTLFECFGVSLRVCASSEDVLERIEQHMPLDRTEGGSLLTAHRMGIVTDEDLTYAVFNSNTQVTEGASLELALVTLEGQVRSYISLHASGLIFVRAGVVGYAGRAILLPGESFSGKTTLVGALVRAGADYYSDECAVLDADGRVHPFRNAAATSGGSGGIPRDSVNAAAGHEPLPVALVVKTYFVPGTQWKPTRITGAGAPLELLADTLTVWTRPDEAVKTVTRMLDGTVMLKGERGEADEMAGQLLQELVELAPS